MSKIMIIFLCRRGKERREWSCKGRRTTTRKFTAKIQVNFNESAYVPLSSGGSKLEAEWRDRKNQKSTNIIALNFPKMESTIVLVVSLFFWEKKNSFLWNLCYNEIWFQDTSTKPTICKRKILELWGREVFFVLYWANLFLNKNIWKLFLP